MINIKAIIIFLEISYKSLMILKITLLGNPSFIDSIKNFLFK